MIFDPKTMSKFIMRKGAGGAWTDSHSMTVNNALSQLKVYKSPVNSIMLHRLTWATRILNADGSYRMSDRSKEYCSISGLAAYPVIMGPNNGDNAYVINDGYPLNWVMSNHVDLGSMDFTFFYDSVFGYDSVGNTFNELVGSSVTTNMLIEFWILKTPI